MATDNITRETAGSNTQADSNKQLVRTLTERAFNHGELSDLAERFTADYVVHAPGVPPLPPGPKAFEMAVRLWRDAFPDIHVTVEDVIAEGEEVYARFTTRGTHRGFLMGIPPTGRQVTIHEMSCHRVVDGKVVESWIGDNVPNILYQIGALAPVGGPPGGPAGGPAGGPPAGAGHPVASPAGGTG